MATGNITPVTVAPIATRASWARQRTIHDTEELPPPATPVEQPRPKRVAVIVEYTSQADLDRVLDHAERVLKVVAVI